MTATDCERFPILSLSPDIFDLISGALNWDELLEFSQCSESSEQLVKRLFANQYTSDIIFDVKLTSRPSVLVMRDNPIEWKFYDKRSPKRIRYSELETKSVAIRDFDSDSGSPIIKTLLFHVKRANMVIGFHDSIKDVILFVKHLAELFNLSIRTLTIDAQHLDHLETILSFNLFKKVDILSIGSGTVSHEQMRQVLENFQPELLSVYCSPEREFEFDGIISSGHIHDAERRQSPFSTVDIENNTAWFRLSMLRTLNCVNFDLDTWTIKNEELNQFLHLWCTGTDTNRMKMSFSRGRLVHDNELEEQLQRYEDGDWEEDKFEIQKIIRGLESFLLLPKNHNSPPVLQRHTDGMLMSVEVVELYMETACTLTPSFQDDVDPFNDVMMQVMEAMADIDVNGAFVEEMEQMFR